MTKDEYYYIYHTDIGTITIACDTIGITKISFGEILCEAAKKEEVPLIKEAAKQLTEYLQGKRQTFDVALHAEGTEFQKNVWRALTNIPYGETRSYADIAEKIGNPKAVRAVGMANHNNSIAIIVPCHRVIGKNGSLTGYAGGLSLKQKLLHLEQEK